MSNENDHSWLKQGSTSAADVAKNYDDWASTYNDDLVDWDYRSPAAAARLLQAMVSSDATILDAGCGTGLTGSALKAADFTGPIDGTDISQASLDEAGAQGVYRNLRQADMQKLPLDFADDVYDGLICIGVLTYVPDSGGVLREFARMVRPGGAVVISQRSDLFQERAFAKTIKGLTKAGIYADATITEPRPYLPGNPDFGTEIEVIYVAMIVA